MKYKNSFIFTVVCGLSSSLLSTESPESVLAAALSQSSKDNTVDVMRRAKQTIINESLLVKENLQANTLTVVNGGVVNGGLSVQGPLLVNGSTAIGPVGPAGANGAAGATGATGATGAAGANGTNGTNGVISYGFLFNNTAGAATVAASTNCADFTNARSNNMTADAAAGTLTIVNTGTYAVQVYVAGKPTGGAGDVTLLAQLVFYVSVGGFDALVGVANAGPISAGTGGTQMLACTYILDLTAGQIIRLRNASVDSAGIASPVAYAATLGQINVSLLLTQVA